MFEEEKSLDTYVKDKDFIEYKVVEKCKNSKYECLSVNEVKTKTTMSKTNNYDDKAELLEIEEMPQIQGNYKKIDVESIKIIKYLNKYALKHKNKGSVFFREGKIESALTEYKKVIHIINHRQ
jgi:tetratricopeptide (TPR) repeat protein